MNDASSLNEKLSLFRTCFPEEIARLVFLKTGFRLNTSRACRKRTEQFSSLDDMLDDIWVDNGAS
jgi:hypothetical protein